MRDASNRILYVGKAKNLRNRIRSYFQSPETIAPKTRLLMRRVADIEFTVTNTELEALLLECNLIKQHRPRYNIRLKDDKNYPYVVLDFTRPFPQFRITRKVIPSPKLRYFGPYSAGVNEIGRFLLKTFQIRDCSDSKFNNRTRPCLNYEIGTCTAPCVKLVNEDDYGKQIQEAILFLKGKKQHASEVVQARNARRRPTNRSTSGRETIRDKILAMEKMSEKQDAVLAEKQNDIDVIGIHVADSAIQFVVLFVRAGYLTGRRAEKVPTHPGVRRRDDANFLEQFYTISLIPDEIWIASEFPDREILEQFLTQRAGKGPEGAFGQGEAERETHAASRDGV